MCQFSKQKGSRAIMRHVCLDHYILLLNYLSNHMHFLTNGFKRFSKTNLTNRRPCVPLISKSGYQTDPFPVRNIIKSFLIHDPFKLKGQSYQLIPDHSPLISLSYCSITLKQLAYWLYTVYICCATRGISYQLTLQW